MALALASCLVGLLLCEAGLRLFHPKYKHLAEAAIIRGPNLVPVRLPNRLGVIRQPDTGARHALFHNNHGFRQHRNFSAADLESSVNIGFFGDSYTENVGMEAQFSFTEPLDYLLNVAGGKGVNVLNFGMFGYGTSQSLLRYETWDFRETLDHAFYVYYRNDLRDNLADGLFRLDDAGQLVRGDVTPSRFSLLSRLHLSYLLMDAGGRLVTHVGGTMVEAEWPLFEYRPAGGEYLNPEIPRSAFPLFRQLLRRWKEAAEGNGASFHLVQLPLETSDSAEVAAIAREEGVETLNLQDCFGKRDPAHLRTSWQSSPYRFKRDQHWNEAGNRLAAVCLHRFLEGRLGLPRLTEEQVDQALRLYYSAFEAPAAGGARGASPRIKTGGGGARGASPRMKRAQGDAIRRKYGAIDGTGAGRPSWTPSPDKLVVRSRFDVHLHDGWLAYFKEGCKPADFDAHFFLHLFPVDVQDLPPDRLKHGFDNWDFRRGANEEGCLIRRKLPDYAIELLRTGQFVEDGNGGYEVLWQGEHAF